MAESRGSSLVALGHRLLAAVQATRRHLRRTTGEDTRNLLFGVAEQQGVAIAPTSALEALGDIVSLVTARPRSNRSCASPTPRSAGARTRPRSSTRSSLPPARSPPRHALRAAASPGTDRLRETGHSWTARPGAGRHPASNGRCCWSTKGAVPGSPLERALATQLDESEQRPTRDAGRRAAAPSISGRLHRPGTHARSGREAESVGTARRTIAPGAKGSRVAA